MRSVPQIRKTSPLPKKTVSKNIMSGNGFKKGLGEFDSQGNKGINNTVMERF